MTLVFTADDVMKTENDVSLCKLDVDVKTCRRSLVASAFFKLEKKLFTGKVLLCSKFYFENQIWYIKRYARKNIDHGCTVWIEKSVTQDHFSASLGRCLDADQ